MFEYEWDAESLPPYVKHCIDKGWGYLTGEKLINHFVHHTEQWKFRYTLLCVENHQAEIAAYFSEIGGAMCNESEITYDDMFLLEDIYSKNDDKISVLTFIADPDTEGALNNIYHVSTMRAYYDGMFVHSSDNLMLLQQKAGKLVGDAGTAYLRKLVSYGFSIDGIWFCPCKELFHNYPLYVMHLRSDPSHQRLVQLRDRKNELQSQLDTCTRKCPVNDIRSLCDPVTKSVFVDPVQLHPCGHTMERQNYDADDSKLCPECRTAIESMSCNQQIKRIIHDLYQGTREEIMQNIDDIDLDLCMGANMAIVQACDAIKHVEFPVKQTKIMIGDQEVLLYDLIQYIVSMHNSLEDDQNMTIKGDVSISQLDIGRILQEMVLRNLAPTSQLEAIPIEVLYTQNP